MKRDSHCGETPQQKVEEMLSYNIRSPLKSRNIKDLETLGSYIKLVRGFRGKTLREVEMCSGISNSYLSQLENDLIKKPSANVLYRISNFLECDFNTLLKLAGVVETDQTQSTIKPVYFETSLTDAEEKLLRDFLKYIRGKR